jgi:hypothetical protein
MVTTGEIGYEYHVLDIPTSPSVMVACECERYVKNKERKRGKDGLASSSFIIVNRVASNNEGVNRAGLYAAGPRVVQVMMIGGLMNCRPELSMMVVFKEVYSPR